MTTRSEATLAARNLLGARRVSRVFVDSFSGAVADLKRGQRNAEGVLAALAKNPRVSVWDMSEHAWLRNSIADLNRRGLIAEQGEPYPWLRYKVVTPNEKVSGAGTASAGLPG